MRVAGAIEAIRREIWLLAQKPWIVPIPGTTNPQHLAENLGAVEVKFTPDELREIRAAVSKIKVQGARPHGSLPDDARSSRMS